MHIPEDQQPVERVEQVSIQLVHVGDYVYASPARSQPLCVVAKVAIRSRPLHRIVGWQLELVNGTVMLLLRDALVQRRRFETAPASTPVRTRTRTLTRAA